MEIVEHGVWVHLFGWLRKEIICIPSIKMELSSLRLYYYHLICVECLKCNQSTMRVCFQFHHFYLALIFFLLILPFSLLSLSLYLILFCFVSSCSFSRFSFSSPNNNINSFILFAPFSSSFAIGLRHSRDRFTRHLFPMWIWVMSNLRRASSDWIN